MKWVKDRTQCMKNLRSISRGPELILDLIALERKSDQPRSIGNSTFVWSS